MGEASSRARSRRERRASSPRARARPSARTRALREIFDIARGDEGLESARAVVALSAVALILFQGPKGDGVVNTLNERRVFGSASQAKSAVDYVTYGLIGGFIAMSVALAARG